MDPSQHFQKLRKSNPTGIDPPTSSQAGTLKKPSTVIRKKRSKPDQDAEGESSASEKAPRKKRTTKPKATKTKDQPANILGQINEE